MADKAVISEYTWRSKVDQEKLFSGLPVFVIPSDMSALMRKSTRKQSVTLHCASLAVLADTEKSFREFMKEAWAIGCSIKPYDEDTVLPNRGIEVAVSKWRAARNEGAAKIGGRISADLRKAESAKGIALIRDRWPLPSKEWPTRALLDECGLSLNTVKAALGRRPIEQANYAAKMKRKERRNGKR